MLLPGDSRAEAAGDTSGPGPVGRILSIVPGEVGYRLRIALGEQIVPASADQPLIAGQMARLSLQRPVRLLPWQQPSHAPHA